MPTVDDLPPMPDRQTGQPRPPKAPIVEPSHEKPKPWHPKKVPQPPEGEGPPLEWGYTASRDKLWMFGFAVVLVVCFLMFRGALTPGSTTFGWVTVWPIRVFRVFAGLFIAWGGGLATRISAGADWFMHHSNFVKTYELESVTWKKNMGNAVTVHRLRLHEAVAAREDGRNR